jgi:hypothetical protein
MCAKPTLKSITFALISALFLAGCTSPAVSTPTTKATEIIATTRPTITESPPTNQPTVNTTIISKQNRTQNCLSVGDEVPLESVAKGTILFHEDKHSPYLLDLETHAQHNLPEEMKDFFNYNLDTSPNYDYLAYMEGFADSNSQPQSSKIWVVNSRGKVVAWQSISINNVSPYWQWVNNDTIQFFTYPKEPGIGKEYLYKPFTRELVDYTKDLPMLYKGGYIDKSVYMVDHSPDLEWAIYFADQNLSGGGPIAGPIVYDLSNQREIWKKVGDNTIGSLPLWSPRGDKVAVAIEGKLYIVSRDGIVISPSGLAEDEQIESEKFAWSPDGRYIAFWATKAGMGYLMLYDVENDLIIDYCIQDLGVGNSLIWSPDSSLFITNVVYQATADQRGEFTVLVDIKNNKAYKIPSKPKAWMNSEISP